MGAGSAAGGVGGQGLLPVCQFLGNLQRLEGLHYVLSLKLLGLKTKGSSGDSGKLT
jgi:hypothetical protein